MRTFAIVLILMVQCLRAQTPVDRALQDVTAVIVHDVFSPPAASRIYAYTCLAGYEAYRLASGGSGILCEGVTNMPCVQINDQLIIQDPSNAAAYAMYLTARSFIYSEGLLMDRCRSTMDTLYAEQSAEFKLGKLVSDAITGWSKSDGYAQTRTLPRYSPLGTPGSWEPTPPDYADGVEPYWGQLRRFIAYTDSLPGLAPAPDFDTSATGHWYTSSKLVIAAAQFPVADQQTIIRFWDDNPFTLVQRGHLQYAEKKVSPAGHWLDITRTALDSAKADPSERVFTYSLVAITMADAFMESWEAKYTYHVLRPETFINRYIDDTWRPFLNSPPFPEYPSGHACISAAAATILTYLFGDSQAFTDASETQYALPARTFPSFKAAAEEAGFSRFYGGIHYDTSVVAGSYLGEQVANGLIREITR